MTLPKTILVPHDFGTGSEHALSYAIELAKPLGAEIVVMHAYEIPMIGFPDGALIATAELASQVLEGANLGLKKAVEAHANAGVPLRGVVKQGPIWQTIIDTAKEIDAGMIAMGTHGRHGLPRALLGSVAEKVVRSAPCPVLTVHSSDVGV
ncbi:MAG: Universal stress protein UspA, partial [Myxococcaceae bacterium]|nr:Universal stress protein UspA [Myxococcaceae bacterium]